MAKRIAILGSTGSIGKNALRVIEALGDGYEVCALSANSSVELLSEQVKRYHPRYAAVTDESCVEKFRGLVAGIDIEVLSGPEGLERIAAVDDIDIVLTAVVGAAGLGSVLTAAENGKTIAIANKEPLVVAGQLLMRTARENGVTIVPVDSEHSAIFQALQAGRREDVKKIILTGSGGPFRGKTIEQIENASRDDALNHPVWNMGPKITVDSATMMNKALEVIEARWLFDIPVDKIEVLIHPQSVIHSMVEFVDGSIIAQMGTPDMCVPIQYALTYPARAEGIARHLQLDKLSTLTFEKPDTEVFRALKLGYDVARTGGTAAAVFNAANEAAVELFLNGRIQFLDITRLIEQTLEHHEVIPQPNLEQLLETDKAARKYVQKEVMTLS
ncbi:MAG: 1-deoxy-D-xylulose-5-phosphate reductoisomerase [Phycisphaerae bacterium]|nr:1-deoxy-D-xylulose-5-phosphate reductoisomerase [Phycisphaerae bacterium]